MPATAERVQVVVLAAGAGTRFGGDKLSALLDGRPILQHVLDAIATAGADEPIVVVPPSRLEAAAIDWRGAKRVVNPDPARGLSSSVRVAWSAALAGSSEANAVLILLGDQPTVEPALIRALLDAPLDSSRPVLASRHRDGSPNPVRVEIAAASWIESLDGDRGFGPLLDSHPELVRWLDGGGSNPDVDEPSDLEALERARGIGSGSGDHPGDSA